MKKIFFLISFFISFFSIINFSLALSLLPANSYLQFGDNQKEVLILQQILNSDPDTLISADGVGSPGHENWYFGMLTQDAVKRFQQKYNLSITGKIDFKTWKKINDVVTNQSTPKVVKTTKTTTTPSKIVPKIDDQHQNIYLDNSSTKTQTTNTSSASQPTYLDSMLNKYVGRLTGLSPYQSTSNSYSPSTPYYNPETGSYQGTPSAGTSYSATPVYSPYSSGGYSGMNAPAQYSQGLPFGNTGGNPSNFFGGLATAGNINNAGQVSGLAGDIGQCRATSFAHATLAEGCVADRADQQNGQRSASGKILSRPGVPAIPAVALPSRGSFGDAVEVKDLSTGKCKAFPLLDRGPASFQVAKGICIDLTGSAVDILKGRQPCQTVGNLGEGKEGKEGIDKVQYAIVPGEKMKPGEVKDCKNLAN